MLCDYPPRSVRTRERHPRRRQSEVSLSHHTIGSAPRPFGASPASVASASTSTPMLLAVRANRVRGHITMPQCSLNPARRAKSGTFSVTTTLLCSCAHTRSVWSSDPGRSTSSLTATASMPRSRSAAAAAGGYISSSRYRTPRCSGAEEALTTLPDLPLTGDRVVVGRDAGVDLVGVGAPVARRSLDRSRCEAEVVGGGGDPLVGITLLVAQHQHDLPDVRARRQAGTPPARAVTEHDTGMGPQLQPLLDRLLRERGRGHRVLSRGRGEAGMEILREPDGYDGHGDTVVRCRHIDHGGADNRPHLRLCLCRCRAGPAMRRWCGRGRRAGGAATCGPSPTGPADG